MNITDTTLPAKDPARVEDVIVYESNYGPWDTKSGGSMHVLFALNKQILEQMNQVDPDEQKLAPQVQLGIRAFFSSNLAVGSVGGKHFHRIKREIISLPKGSVEFLLEDVYGGKLKITLNKTTRAICIPAFVMHTYTVLEPTELLGVSNTLYDHDNPATHDTYYNELFQFLSKAYASRAK